MEVTENASHAKLRLLSTIAFLGVVMSVLTIVTQTLDLFYIPMVSEWVDHWMAHEKLPTRAEVADISVTMDRDDRTYLAGDDLQISVISDQPGYVYVFSKSQFNTKLLYPKRPELSNSIAQNKKIRWTTKVGPPFGERTLWVVVAHDPLTLSEIRGSVPTDLNVLSEEQVEKLYDRLKGRDTSQGWKWAEASATFEVINPQP
ncbi:MAG: hypothetical protein ACFCD0_14660 [Gemmataceae bacterium]